MTVSMNFEVDAETQEEAEERMKQWMETKVKAEEYKILEIKPSEVEEDENP